MLTSIGLEHFVKGSAQILMTGTRTVAPALKELLSGLIDYAGLFPPAKLPLETALDNFRAYRADEFSWFLRSFVVPAANINSVPESMNGAISVLSDLDENRAASIESTRPVKSQRPVYCEVPLDKLEMLDAVKNLGCFAKVRTGGLKPEAIPSTADLAQFILACADRSLAFKATAGLHHPVRAVHALTYEDGAPQALMHGFLNVVMAAAFAWRGEREIEPILAETDPSAFSFGDQARWRELSLSLDEIRKARQNFFHSVGSCSFEEPLQDLEKLGLI